jgi:hypothetical protein
MTGPDQTSPSEHARQQAAGEGGTMDVGRAGAGAPVPHTPKSPVRPTEAEHAEVGKSTSEAKVTDDTAAATAAANESGTDAMVAPEDQRQGRDGPERLLYVPL